MTIKSHIVNKTFLQARDSPLMCLWTKDELLIFKEILALPIEVQSGRVGSSQCYFPPLRKLQASGGRSHPSHEGHHHEIGGFNEHIQS